MIGYVYTETSNNSDSKNTFYKAELEAFHCNTLKSKFYYD